MPPDTPTPETDKMERSIEASDLETSGEFYEAMTDFARNLERSRDQWKARALEQHRALDAFGIHKLDCALSTMEHGTHDIDESLCTCGLTAALTRLKDL